jgi:AraC family transcriptional regulator
MSSIHASPRLPRGVFLGRKLIQLGVEDLTVTLSGYQPGARLPRHAHESAYFSIVVSGRYTERVRSSERERAPYSVAFHPPGEEHAEWFCPAPATTLGIELSGSWIRRLLEGGLALDASCLWTEGPTRWTAMRLTRELDYRDQASSLAIEGLILELAAAALRAPTLREAPRWLKVVEEHLRAAPQRISLRDLAELAGVHPVHLARTFRRRHGCTCGEFVRRLRLEAARERIVSSRATLGEIALEAGFSDQSHFTRCFKREIGLTPGEYRARVRR